MNSIIFAFDGDALLVANTGEKFSRKGVVSICHMDLSAKTVNPARRPNHKVYKAQDKGLVIEILDACIKKYDDPNNLIEDVDKEEKVTKSYTGRFMWELLQNADDAMNIEHPNTHLIGTKGIGFKSVLEITDEPEIYSGDFYFHFSREKSREVLESKINKWQWNEEMGIPICRIPHPKEPGPTVRKLFDEGYATVLRLPLNEENRKKVEDELSGFCNRSLLFCQHLGSVDMRIGATSRHIEVHRGDKGRVELIENGHSTHWQVWDKEKEVEGEKRLSVKICLPVVDGKISCLEEVPNLYVFFPTLESLPDVHALIHASCEVEDNRQHLAKQQPHQGKICEMLASMTKKILTEIPANVALRVFGRTHVANDADGGMATQLRNAIAETVRETAFIPLIGGGMAKPGDVRLWKYGPGNAVDPSKVKDQNLCHPDINNDESSVAILTGLRAECASESELARLLRFCRNRTKEECLIAWNAAQSLMANVSQNEKEKCESELRKAPFWLVDNGKARSIDGEIPLVAAEPKDLPRWLRVDVVDKRFRKVIQDEIKRHKEEDENWKDALSGSLHPPERKSGYFDHILLPYCEKLTPEEWQKNGWDVLEMAFKWGEKDGNDEPLIIDSPDSKPKEKQTRAEIFHLPVVGKGARKWAPALQCYAGAAWGGPGIFDEYFVRVEDRHVLSSAGDWKIRINGPDKGQWKKLLSWLGCSWGWKMKMESGLVSKRNDVDHTSGRPFSDFHFEHFNEMFAIPHSGKASDYASLLNMVPEMYGIADKMKARYFYHKDKVHKSLALQQLKENKWLSCEQSFFSDKRLFKPEDAYLPGFGLNGLLPEVNKRNLDSSAWDAVEETLKKLGAQNSVPKDPDQLIGYMNRLSKSHGKNKPDSKWTKNDKGRSKIARAAKAIFSAYAKIESPPSLTGDVMVPCLRHTRQGEEIYFEKAANVYWADKSYLGEAEVRRKILKADKLHVFFRFLQEGESFGLDKLSEHLRLEPKFGTEKPEAAKELCDRYKQRRAGMAKAVGQKLPEQLNIVAYDNIALQATTYAEITIPKIKFWKRSEREIDVNAGTDMWQGLAAALEELTNRSQLKAHFQLLLKEETWDSFLNLLREDYNLTEDSISEVEEKAPFDDDSDNMTESDSGAGQGTDSDESEHASDSTKNNVSKNNVKSKADMKTGVSGNAYRQHGGFKPPSRAPRGEPKQKHGVDSVSSNRPTNQGGAGHINPEPGLKAEWWLRGELEKRGFEVDRTGTGSDYQVRSGGGSALIEVKHVEGDSGQIYLSQRQIKEAEKCRENGQNYFVAIVSGDEENRKVFWFWNPLDDFAPMKRIRLWERSAEGVDMDAETEWDVAKPSTDISWKNPMYKVCVKIEANSMSEGGGIVSACEQLKGKLENGT